MARISRSRAAAAAAAAAAVIRTPSPIEPSDSEAGAAPSLDESQSGDELEQDLMDIDNEEGVEDHGMQAADSAAESASATPNEARSGARRRRGGRSRGSTRQRETSSHDARTHDSDAATPRKRGGWRGRGFGAGRWAKAKGGSSHATQWPVDKEGNTATIVNDEVELPEDVEGEQKVNKNGELGGGREYRVRTFKIQGKGERLYMLSTEPARCIGFRDSYLFFQKHKQLYKIIVEEDAKKDLIERGLIPHSYKGRHIGVVTARSVFREFGAKILVGGRKIVDDYNVAEARARGDVEGDFAVPEDDVPVGPEHYDRNRYVAWHGASNVYHTGAPSVPMMHGKSIDNKRRKVTVTGANWMLEHALQASRFNSQLARQRRQTLEGVYNIHTNVMQYPETMQPTRARWEHVGDEDDHKSEHDCLSAHEEQALHAQRLPSKMKHSARKFMIVDTHFDSMSMSSLQSSRSGWPGISEEEMDLVPGFANDVLTVLPDDCRKNLLHASLQERQWGQKWGSEHNSTMRANVRVTYNV